MSTADLTWIVPLSIAGVCGLVAYIKTSARADRLADRVEELKDEVSRLRERADKTK